MPEENKNILNANDQTGLSRAKPFQFDDVRAMAAKILRNANTQAQAMLESARKESKAIQQKAFEEGMAAGKEAGEKKGYEEGLASGDAQGRDEILQQTAGLTDTVAMFLDALDNERATLANAAEVDLLRLSLDIAKRIVRHELSVNPETIREVVMAAVEMTVSRTDITLFVNPEDLQRVEQFLPDIPRRFANVTRVNLMPDPEVAPGGVRATTRDGEVDLRLESQFEAIERALLGQVDTEDEIA